MDEETLQVRIPESLAKRVAEKGVDPEAFIIDAVERALNLDPHEELEVRLDIAKYMVKRAREELEKGDAVQASEKLYKAVEECIKVLACLEGLEECRRAREEGGWWTRLLARAAARLSRMLGEELIVRAWSYAYDLHVHGFHEHTYSVEDVKPRVRVVEELLEYTRQRFTGRVEDQG